MNLLSLTPFFSYRKEDFRLKNRILIYFFYLFLLVPNLLVAKPILVSLGLDCQVAMKTREFKIRNGAFPFDWVISDDFESVIAAIEDNFKHWLDPKYLQYKDYQIFNSLYGISFVHDFPVLNESKKPKLSNFEIIDPNFLGSLTSITQKHDRRIERLFSLLNSSEELIFIRTEATPSQAKRFVNLIKQRYPKLVFKLVVICPPKLLNVDWNIDGVENFYGMDAGMHPWWWGNQTWEHVFKQLKLID